METKIKDVFLGLSDEDFTEKVEGEVNKVETTKENVLKVLQDLTGMTGAFKEGEENTFCLINPATGHRIDFIIE